MCNVQLLPVGALSVSARARTCSSKGMYVGSCHNTVTVDNDDSSGSLQKLYKSIYPLVLNLSSDIILTITTYYYPSLNAMQHQALQLSWHNLCLPATGQVRRVLLLRQLLFRLAKIRILRLRWVLNSWTASCGNGNWELLGLEFDHGLDALGHFTSTTSFGLGLSHFPLTQWLLSFLESCEINTPWCMTPKPGASRKARNPKQQGYWWLIRATLRKKTWLQVSRYRYRYPHFHWYEQIRTNIYHTRFSMAFFHSSLPENTSNITGGIGCFAQWYLLLGSPQLRYVKSLRHFPKGPRNQPLDDVTSGPAWNSLSEEASWKSAWCQNSSNIQAPGPRSPSC